MYSAGSGKKTQDYVHMLNDYPVQQLNFLDEFAFLYQELESNILSKDIAIDHQSDEYLMMSYQKWLLCQLQPIFLAIQNSQHIPFSLLKEVLLKVFQVNHSSNVSYFSQPHAIETRLMVLLALHARKISYSCQGIHVFLLPSVKVMPEYAMIHHVEDCIAFLSSHILSDSGQECYPISLLCDIEIADLYPNVVQNPLQEHLASSLSTQEVSRLLQHSRQTQEILLLKNKLIQILNKPEEYRSQYFNHEYQEINHALSQIQNHIRTSIPDQPSDQRGFSADFMKTLGLEIQIRTYQDWQVFLRRHRYHLSSFLENPSVKEQLSLFFHSYPHSTISADLIALYSDLNLSQICALHAVFPGVLQSFLLEPESFIRLFNSIDIPMTQYVVETLGLHHVRNEIKTHLQKMTALNDRVYGDILTIFCRKLETIDDILRLFDCIFPQSRSVYNIYLFHHHTFFEIIAKSPSNQYLANIQLLEKLLKDLSLMEMLSFYQKSLELCYRSFPDSQLMVKTIWTRFLQEERTFEHHTNLKIAKKIYSQLIEKISVAKSFHAIAALLKCLSKENQLELFHKMHPFHIAIWLSEQNDPMKFSVKEMLCFENKILAMQPSDLCNLMNNNLVKIGKILFNVVTDHRVREDYGSLIAGYPHEFVDSLESCEVFFKMTRLRPIQQLAIYHSLQHHNIHSVVLIQHSQKELVPSVLRFLKCFDHLVQSQIITDLFQKDSPYHQHHVVTENFVENLMTFGRKKLSNQGIDLQQWDTELLAVVNVIEDAIIARYRKERSADWQISQSLLTQISPLLLSEFAYICPDYCSMHLSGQILPQSSIDVIINRFLSADSHTMSAEIMKKTRISFLLKLMSPLNASLNSQFLSQLHDTLTESDFALKYLLLVNMNLLQKRLWIALINPLHAFPQYLAALEHHPSIINALEEFPNFQIAPQLYVDVLKKFVQPIAAFQLLSPALRSFFMQYCDGMNHLVTHATDIAHVRIVLSFLSQNDADLYLSHLTQKGFFEKNHAEKQLKSIAKFLSTPTLQVYLTTIASQISSQNDPQWLSLLLKASLISAQPSAKIIQLLSDHEIFCLVWPRLISSVQEEMFPLLYQKLLRFSQIDQLIALLKVLSPTHQKEVLNHFPVDQIMKKISSVRDFQILTFYEMSQIHRVLALDLSKFIYSAQNLIDTLSLFSTDFEQKRILNHPHIQKNLFSWIDDFEKFALLIKSFSAASFDASSQSSIQEVFEIIKPKIWALFMTSWDLHSLGQLNDAHLIQQIMSLTGADFFLHSEPSATAPVLFSSNRSSHLDNDRPTLNF